MGIVKLEQGLGWLFYAVSCARSTLSLKSCSRDPERMNAILLDHFQFLHEELLWSFDGVSPPRRVLFTLSYFWDPPKVGLIAVSHAGAP